MSVNGIGPACVLCSDKNIHAAAVAVPVIVVPVIGYPAPLYLRFKGALCRPHVHAFNMETFVNHYGPQWYEMAADHLRSVRKPAINPFPDDPSFKWEDFIIDPNFEAVPKEECFIQFWAVETLAAKGAHKSIV